MTLESVETAVDRRAETSKPVKIVLERRVPLPARHAFEDLVTELVKSAGAAETLEGSSVLSTSTGEYIILLRFTSQDALDRWTASPSARDVFRRIDAVAISADRAVVQSGLETWFALPTLGGTHPPPKWKMAIVTWCALLPQVVALGLIVPHDLPFPIGVAVSTAIPVAMLTWVIMPRLTKLLSGWLYPAAPPPTPSAISERREHVVR